MLSWITAIYSENYQRGDESKMVSALSMAQQNLGKCYYSFVSDAIIDCEVVFTYLVTRESERCSYHTVSDDV